MNYLGISIRMRKYENTIIIDYGDPLTTVAKNVLDDNIVFACFNNVVNKYGFKSYWVFLGTQYKRDYENLSNDVFDEINKSFFNDMDVNVEKVLNLVFTAMNTPLSNYLTSSNGSAFNVLQYFADIGEIPDINDFYQLNDITHSGIKQTAFQNIKRDIRYTIYDYTESSLKKFQTLKNKFVVKVNNNESYNKTILRCKTYDAAFSYIKTNVNFVKEVKPCNLQQDM